MKKFVIMLFIGIFLCLSNAYSTELVLPNGQKLNVDGLSDSEKQAMLTYMDKIEKAKKTIDSNTMEKAKEIISDPDELRKWSKLITDTIRDICEDLNVTVNEFIKTPAGLGVSILIIYKIAGPEMVEGLGDIIDIFLMVPLWCIVIFTLMYVKKKFLTDITIYQNKVVNEKHPNKFDYSKPMRVPVYKWASDDARATLGASLMIIGGAMTIVAICIVFA